MTSSAAKNYASRLLEGPVALDKPSSYVVSERGEEAEGFIEDGQFKIRRSPFLPKNPLEEVDLQTFKPTFALFQRSSDAFNTPYLGAHNIGFPQIHQKLVENAFLTARGAEYRRVWNVASEVYWQAKDRGF